MTTSDERDAVDRLQALWDADARCTEVLGTMLEAHKDRKTHAIQCTQSEWHAQEDAFAARDAARAALMPTERDAIRLMFEAYSRLKELGWNDPTYCPKDGSTFDVIEPGSTGIFRGHYDGEWPTGSWWLEDGGDICPSRPILYRVTEAEKAKREEARLKFREIFRHPEHMKDDKHG